MNFIGLSILLGLIMTSPIASKYCFDVGQSRNMPMHSFKHLSTDLTNLSVAPWSYSNTSDASRMPQTIYSAVCDSCRVPNMVAKPIFLVVSVFKRSLDRTQWCMKPFMLSVGCTCVPQSLVST